MFRDLGGIKSLTNELTREVIVPLLQLKLLRHLGVEPTARILLHGPPGCGKTALARAISNEAGLPLYEISAAHLVSGVAGAPKEKIRELFSTAYMKAPSVVLIDKIDAMTSKMESLWNQLIACMDEPYKLFKPVNHNADPESSTNNRPGYVLVIGATNLPDALDPALRQRFDREFGIDVPDEYARLYILSLITSNLKVEVGFSLEQIARCTMGFVAGELVALAKKAGINAVNRIMIKRSLNSYKEQRVRVQLKDCYRQPFHDEELENLSITMEDFVEAGKMVRPSSEMKRFSTTPNTKWADVGGLQLLKMEFESHIVKHIKFPEVYKDLKLNLVTTVFLYRPPGCGKTLLVEALANETGANFMHIKAPQLLKFGDESSWVVQNISSYASSHAPCIVFFDELDAMTQFGVEEEMPDFGQLMLELNDTEALVRGVYMIGATSRPEVVSHISLIRTQFDKVLYVPFPNPKERGEILKSLSRNKPIDANMDLMALAEDVACENFSGRDLSALMREAAMAAIDRPTLFDGGCSVPLIIKDEDFRSALSKVSPSLSSKQVKNWEKRVGWFATRESLPVL